MMYCLLNVVKRHRLASFFVLACALSWWPWILYSFHLSPTLIMGLPFLRLSLAR